MSQNEGTLVELLGFTRRWFSIRNWCEFLRYMCNFLLRMGLIYYTVVPIKIFEHAKTNKGIHDLLLTKTGAVFILYLIVSALLVYIGMAISLYIPKGGEK